MFELDEHGHPLTVTGVPPDYFSSEGQLWGNPQYRWELMRGTGFRWWLQRFASAARQFDIARIDHFRALESYWEIPADATSAKTGHWVPARITSYNVCYTKLLRCGSPAARWE